MSLPEHPSPSGAARGWHEVPGEWAGDGDGSIDAKKLQSQKIVGLELSSTSSRARRLSSQIRDTVAKFAPVPASREHAVATPQIQQKKAKQKEPDWTPFVLSS